MLVSTALIAIPLALLTTASTFIGGLIALRFRRQIGTIIALTGGIVVAVALFDVLPEAMEAVNDPKRAATLIGAGFLAFFLAERFIVLHHRDETEQARAHARVGALGAAGLSAHSFVDGLGIGLAFSLNTTTGLLVFLAVITHDFADGFNTVTFVLRQSDNHRQAVRWLAADAVAPLAGATLGSLMSVSERQLGYLLSLYVGVFLVIGATDLLPHAHEHPSFKNVLLTLAGFGVVFAVSLVAVH